MRKHSTELIATKMVSVDTEIISLVNWLNSFSGVDTTFSCQGEVEVERRNDLPYVLFTCAWDISLVKILRVITAFAGNFSDKIAIGIDYFDEHLPIRYNLVFLIKKCLMNLLNSLLIKHSKTLKIY